MRYIICTWVFLLCTVAAVAQSAYDERTGMSLFNKSSYSEALPYLQRAAKSGSLEAVVALGQMYEKGLGVNKNPVVMLNMYGKAVQGNYLPAMMHLGGYYKRNSNAQKAFELWMKAAKAGSDDAWFLVGECYELGYGVGKNWEKAVDCYFEGSVDERYPCYLARVSATLGNLKNAYGQYMRAYEKNALTDFGLEALVDMLCCDTSIVFRNTREKDIAMLKRIGQNADLYIKNARMDNSHLAGEILLSYKDKYPDEVKRIAAKCGADMASTMTTVAKRKEEDRKEVIRKEENRQFRSSRYNELMQASTEVDLEHSGTDLRRNKELPFMNVPYLKKKLVKAGKYFSGNFSMSFFMKSKADDIHYRGGNLFYKTFGNDVNYMSYPAVGIEGGLLVLKTGKASYQSRPFKQFPNAGKTLFDGNWHHVVLSFNKDLKKADVCVDGTWKGNEYIGSDEIIISALVFCGDRDDLKIADLRFFEDKVLDVIDAGVLSGLR